MILGFKTHINGQPTGFVDKITSGQKIHTLREDPKGRWKVGATIQFATGVRTKNYNRFYQKSCKNVDQVFMMVERGTLFVAVNGRYLNANELALFARNDGFDSIMKFAEWFFPIVEKEQGGKTFRLIQWTDFRY